MLIVNDMGEKFITSTDLGNSWSNLHLPSSSYYSNYEINSLSCKADCSQMVASYYNGGPVFVSRDKPTDSATDIVVISLIIVGCLIGLCALGTMVWYFTSYEPASKRNMQTSVTPRISSRTPVMKESTSITVYLLLEDNENTDEDIAQAQQGVIDHNNVQ